MWQDFHMIRELNPEKVCLECGKTPVTVIREFNPQDSLSKCGKTFIWSGSWILRQFVLNIARLPFGQGVESWDFVLNVARLSYDQGVESWDGLSWMWQDFPLISELNPETVCLKCGKTSLWSGSWILGRFVWNRHFALMFNLGPDAFKWQMS